MLGLGKHDHCWRSFVIPLEYLKPRDVLLLSLFLLLELEWQCRGVALPLVGGLGVLGNVRDALVDVTAAEGAGYCLVAAAGGAVAGVVAEGCVLQTNTYIYIYINTRHSEVLTL